MSHFSRVKTSLKNREHLQTALRQLGYTVTEGGMIRGYQGQKSVEFSIQGSKGYGIGFVKNPEGTYDMVADWWGVKGATQERISQELHRIQQEYALQTVLTQTEKEGYSIVENVRDEKGTIRIVVRRWR